MAQFTHQFQTNQPLYPQALYNRPLTRLSRASGRLVTIGGHKQSFANAAGWSSLAEAAGLGSCELILPDSLQRLVGFAPGVSFVPATPAGSIAQAAIQSIIQSSEDADGLAFGWDLSANSDTTIALEHLLKLSNRPIALFGDGLIALRQNPQILAANPRNLLILNQTEATRLAGKLGIGLAPHQNMLTHKLRLVSALRLELPVGVALIGPQLIIATDEGHTVTPVQPILVNAPVALSAILSTWWIQHATNPLIGLTTAAYIISQMADTLTSQNQLTNQHLVMALNSALKAADDTDW